MFCVDRRFYELILFVCKINIDRIKVIKCLLSYIRLGVSEIYMCIDRVI